MKLARAIVFGIILWILIFIEVSVLMFGFGLEEGFVYYSVHYVLLALFSVLISLIYFGGWRVNAGLGNGLLLGIMLVLISFILDVIITVELFVKDYTFFNDIYLWFGFVEIVVVSVIVGILKG